MRTSADSAPPTTFTCSAVLLASGMPVGPDVEALLWTSVAGQPLVARSLSAFVATPQIGTIVLVIAPHRLSTAQKLLDTIGDSRVQVMAAQETRQHDTLQAAIAALPVDIKLVCIHQCSRPFVTPTVITQGIALAEAHSGSGTIACEPVKETIKRVTDGVVVATPPRAGLVLLQTPQVFPREALVSAYQQSHFTGDVADAALVALAAGIPLITFFGGHDNISVSQPGDLLVKIAVQS